ncbi:RusA family crossover junction endodeoxyribonuclease [Megasphaera massiliensis]|uniref:RusA family crossover junction endodeoxyribonuclease n=1 Tax=Megasphaera massiliensis TaxID=1232428 RepID=UPI001E47E116|nr:RusA family crossover junction endodeoxyribonuclease [Megasphaera massiliensis]
MAGKKIDKAYIKFHWVEKNKRRDKDNIAFAKKFILDALQEMGILQNDGWSEILGFSDTFDVDKDNPRIEVSLLSEEELKKYENQ